MRESQLIMLMGNFFHVGMITYRIGTTILVPSKGFVDSIQCSILAI